MEDFWYGMEIEWKKFASMEYGKIVFHSIPYHALVTTRPGITASIKLQMASTPEQVSMLSKAELLAKLPTY